MYYLQPVVCAADIIAINYSQIIFLKIRDTMILNNTHSTCHTHTQTKYYLNITKRFPDDFCINYVKLWFFLFRVHLNVSSCVYLTPTLLNQSNWSMFFMYSTSVLPRVDKNKSRECEIKKETVWWSRLHLFYRTKNIYLELKIVLFIFMLYFTSTLI